MIIRDERIVAAGALLPLAETSIHTERFGTRHRAALGITEQTDAVVVVVSEENGQISLVERARIVRNLTEAGLARAIQALLDPAGGRRGAFGWRSASQRGALAGRSPRLRELGRFVGRAAGHARAVGDRQHANRRDRRPAEPARDQGSDAASGRRRRHRAGGRPGPAVRRILGSRIVHNWPLKLAAVGLATLMYGGLALSQNTPDVPGRRSRSVRQRAGQHGRLPARRRTRSRTSATSRRAACGSPRARSWPRSTWPGSRARPGRSSVPIECRTPDARVRVLSFEPTFATVQLDSS